MDRLHAYWRMPYITGELSGDAPKHKNPFSQIHLSVNDRENLILFRARWNYIVLNRYPYNAGHLLVLPYREVASLDKLTEVERHELIDLIDRAQWLLTQALQPDGFNTGFNFGQVQGSWYPGSSSLSCGPPLEWRHQFHARHWAQPRFARISRRHVATPQAGSNSSVTQYGVVKVVQPPP